MKEGSYQMIKPDLTNDKKQLGVAFLCQFVTKTTE